VPAANRLECQIAGVHVTPVDGLITDGARIVQKRKADEGWFDVSTLEEPHRVEGKKTMGSEMAERMDWRLPGVILYPTGGGTGLVAMWKAFDEMVELFNTGTGAKYAEAFADYPRAGGH
jgi:threonine synthase